MTRRLTARKFDELRVDRGSPLICPSDTQGNAEVVSGPYFTGASRGHFRISLLWMLEGHLEKEPTEATAGQWSLIIRF